MNHDFWPYHPYGLDYSESYNSSSDGSDDDEGYSATATRLAIWNNECRSLADAIDYISDHEMDAGFTFEKYAHAIPKDLRGPVVLGLRVVGEEDTKDSVFEITERWSSHSILDPYYM